MSPEIAIKSKTGKRNISVPDKTGIYDTPFGEVLIDMREVCPSRQEQIIRIGGAGLGVLRPEEKREISLSSQGEGSTRVGSFNRVEVRMYAPIRDRNEWNKRNRERVGYIRTRDGSRHTVYRWVKNNRLTQNKTP